MPQEKQRYCRKQEKLPKPLIFLERFENTYCTPGYKEKRTIRERDSGIRYFFKLIFGNLLRFTKMVVK